MTFKILELTRYAGRAFAVAALAAATLPAAYAAGVPGQGTWETTLQGRDLDGNTANGFEAYYDTALNITWLADPGAGGGGWYAAKAWAANLNVNGITGWRLPDVKPVNGVSFNYSSSLDGSTDLGFGITSTQSELAHMYYVTLGNKAYYSPDGNEQPGGGLTNTGPFSNYGAASDFWFGVGFQSPSCCAWVFVTNTGRQYYNGTDHGLYAWAVHSGDVAAVPEPQTYAMALVGLAALLVTRKRRHA
jgi:hypothetical protein